MKNFLFATVAAFSLLAFPALAGPTENITGCETKPIPGSNATQFVDPTCYKAPEGSGIDPLFVSLVEDLFNPEDESASE
jgi:hypothetical protein